MAELADLALYFLLVSAVSRKTGRSAPAAAAYRSGTLIANKRDGLTHDYRRRRGVEDDFVLVPAGCEWAADRSALWNAAEAAENRKDAKVAREYTVALPAELNKEGRRELSERLGRLIVDRSGVAVDVAVHEPNEGGDSRNFHAHLLTTTRTVGPVGLGAKTRYLDVSTSASVEVECLRAFWEQFVNASLEKIGSTERVTRLSHARRGTGLVPQVRLSVAAVALERRGVRTEKGDRNREIKRLNAELAEDVAEQKRLRASIRWAERRGVVSKEGNYPLALVDSVQAFSFHEWRAASDRRMARAREALGIGRRPPLRSAAEVMARAWEAVIERAVDAELAAEIESLMLPGTAEPKE